MKIYSLVVVCALAVPSLAQTFTVASSEVSQSPTDAGESATYKVTFTPSGGFTGDIKIVAVCPDATCSFDNSTVNVNDTSAKSAVLTIKIPKGKPANPLPVTLISTSGALQISTPIQVATQPEAPATSSSKQSSDTDNSNGSNGSSNSDTLKSDFGFGIALGLAVNTFGPDIVNNASVDADGFVRVNTRSNTAAGIMLESHYFVFPRPNLENINNGDDDNRWWGVGPFAAVQPGTSQIVSSVGGGMMIGFRRPKGTKPSGFGLGFGYEAIPSAQVLQHGWVANQPAPLGPDGKPLQVQYETRDKGSILVVLSVNF